MLGKVKLYPTQSSFPRTSCKQEEMVWLEWVRSGCVLSSSQRGGLSLGSGKHLADFLKPGRMDREIGFEWPKPSSPCTRGGQSTRRQSARLQFASYGSSKHGCLDIRSVVDLPGVNKDCSGLWNFSWWEWISISSIWPNTLPSSWAVLYHVNCSIPICPFPFTYRDN